MLNHLSQALVLLICAISLTGCGRDFSGGADVEHATAVSSSEFSQTMEGKTFFLIGSDPPVHYVVSENGFYKLNDNEQLIQIRTSRRKPGDAGFGNLGIFVKIEDGRAVKCGHSPEILAALEKYLGPRKSTN